MTWADFLDFINREHRLLGLPWTYLFAFGLLGNATFFTRFFVQWVQSERVGRSVVPKLFWHLSIAGSLILLVYFIFKQEPVGILAYLPNAFVYLRNLQLVKREERAAP
ncbi:MAG TPA: lipid-A-disaccharide synthase N-terminal domain-containing protein [Candidatus Sulfotelmatobacter sp.]|nr:lipid-A-disaccharide synthase N-terminal domain-containing protein [Candidatus Sulfotelmatobacter sp.]